MRNNARVAALSGAPKSIAGTAWLERLTAMLRGVTKPQARSLRCVETLQLGPKRSLYLVECEGQRFLVGAGSDGLSAPVPLNQHATRSGNFPLGDATP